MELVSGSFVASVYVIVPDLCFVLGVLSPSIVRILQCTVVLDSCTRSDGSYIGVLQVVVDS